VASTDRLAGTILLALALIWIGATWWMLPAGSAPGQIGPRGFPLGMGVLLACLSLALIAGSRRAEPAEPRAADDVRRDRKAELWALAATFGFLGVYLLLLDLIGFVLATVAVCASFMTVVLKKRSPVLVAATSLGLAFGIWLILGKAMGVYLPRGSWIGWF
jgi:hypothetical protein